MRDSPGLPPQVGVYGYLLGGLGYALLGSSRQLAIGPTSAISLMIAGTVGEMAGGDAQHYAQIASLAGFTVAVLCLIAWLLRLSVLVKLISDSILVGFKAGAGLTIAMTQLPSLLRRGRRRTQFFRAGGAAWPGKSARYSTSCSRSASSRSCCSCSASACCPDRPVALGVVALSIVAASALGLPALGVPTTGEIPAGLPTLEGPGAAAARCRGHYAAGRRMPAARLYRKRFGRPHLRGRSTDTSSTRGRNCSGSARQILQRRWDMATRWPADCRNRP